jgi:hypothetical protein
MAAAKSWMVWRVACCERALRVEVADAGRGFDQALANS